MRARGLAVLIYAAVLASPLRAEEVCGPLKGFSLPLSPSAEGYTIPIGVAGTQHQFLLDLSSAFSKLDQDLADPIAISKKPMPKGFVVADEGGAYATFAILPEVALGPVKRPRTEILIGAHRSSWGQAVGLVGLDMLSGLDLELDLGHDRIGLYLPRDCAFSPFWKADIVGKADFTVEPTGGMKLPLVLDGKKIEAKLDTSKKRTYMSSAVAYLVFGIDVKGSFVTPAGMENGKNLYRYPFKAVVAGQKVTVDSPAIYIYESGTLCGGRAYRDHPDPSQVDCYGLGDIRLGTDLLQKMHIFFAFKPKKIYFTLSEPSTGQEEVQPGPAP